MAKKTVTADQYICNACKTIVLAMKDEPPEGYGGRVIGITEGGGRSAEWWACSQACITEAVINALSEDD
jgi:hypothetical protein